MKRYEHNEEKWIFPFVEYSPLEKKDNLPLIIQLHGAGERGAGNDELFKVDVHGFSEYLKDAQKDCIVIMPQCPVNTFWAARVESIIRFVEQLTEEYSVDKDRVYLTGLSMGGYGTWFSAMASPKLFAAIAPVCGGGMAWNAAVLKKIPIWAFHGAEDAVVSPTQSDEMVAKLQALGANIRYSRIEGVGHNVWENAYTEELFEWLLSNKRK
ncbi:MAG: prolyl oligopeptidase family serine peptidase [Clostridia bacterium]|nr:prolyl oligopeptidase family serine peptidase [Clostridia bacterium]